MANAPIVRSASPLLVLAGAQLAMICAGTEYWYPALIPGLRTALNISDLQAVILVSAGNSGSGLGFIGGFFHARYGTRLIACLGAIFISLSYFALAILTAYPLSANVNFIITLLLTLLLNTASYSLYSTSMSAAAAMFSSEYRGRIVGLSSAFYGASAGIFGTMQAAFFPTLSHTTPLLIFASAITATSFFIAVSIFPGDESYAVENLVPMTSQLSTIEDDKPTSDTQSPSPQPLSHIRFAFSIAWTIVILLQFSAVSNAFHAPHIINYISALLVSSAVLSFTFLPLCSDYRVYASSIDDSPVEPLEPFSTVFFDPRYLLICYGALTLISGGGTAVLVQAPHLVAAHLGDAKEIDLEYAGNIIRNFVIIFSACNVTSRLLTGTIMDRGQTLAERTIWKYDIFTAITVAAMIGMLFAGYLNVVFLHLSYAILGACQGTFYAISPALTTIWFGIQGFPRNFSVTGIFGLVGANVFAGLIPSLLSKHFGSWSMLPVKDNPEEMTDVCIGVVCTAPAFSLFAFLALVMLIAALRIRPLVEREAKYSHL